MFLYNLFNAAEGLSRLHHRRGCSVIRRQIETGHHKRRRHRDCHRTTKYLFCGYAFT